MIKRYLEKYILDDLRDKMVFISGPRQVGKTTLAKDMGEKFFRGSCAYLNWDNRVDRKVILNESFPADKRLFIFDEIHKYKGWKNYLKGEYDKYKDKFSILVTGSARMDIYRRGGDSLLGRYHSYLLHPLSLAELLGVSADSSCPGSLVFSDKEKGVPGIVWSFVKIWRFPGGFQ